MRGINKVIIVGTLGKDVEVRYLPSGNAVASFSVATTEFWKDKNTGQNQEQTEWHQAQAFGKLAEICGEYLRKGSKVYLEGSLKTEKRQDKQTGQDRYATKIKINTMQMLDSRQQGQSESASGGSFPGYEDFDQQPPQRSQQQNSYAQQTRGGGFGGQQGNRGGGRQLPLADDFDSDIPF